MFATGYALDTIPMIRTRKGEILTQSEKIENYISAIHSWSTEYFIIDRNIT